MCPSTGAGNVADTRYLKQRRVGWYFQIAVPTKHRAALGKATITASLRTRDLTVAQERRWAKLIEAMEAFARIERRPSGEQPEPNALLAVDEFARSFYHDTLATMDREARAGTRAWAVADLEESHTVLVDAYFAHAYASVAEPLAAYCEREQVGPGSSLYGEVGDALLSAKMQAVMGRKNALEHKPTSEPRKFLNYVPVDPVSLKPLRATTLAKGLAFSEVAGRFIAEKQRDPAYKLTEQTRGQYEAAYRLFDSWAKKPTLDAVDRRKASDFLDAVAKLDPRWGRGAGVKKMSFDEIAKRFSGGGKGLANKTINRYAMALGMVWQYAEDRDGFEGKNPWTGQMRPTTKRRGNSETDKRGFTPTEVHKVLASPPSTQIALTTDDTLPWLSLIGAYSGMRLNEICSLDLEDVKEVGGILFYDLTEAKSEAGVRCVPVHSQILAAGFKTYLARIKGGSLWPALKPGGPDNKLSWYASKRFTVYRRSLKLIDIDKVTGRDRIDFHSLRRSGITALKRVGIPEADAAEVMGHEHPNVTFGIYPDAHTLRRLQEIVEAISYAA